jgi:hypothetical protein
MSFLGLISLLNGTTELVSACSNDVVQIEVDGGIQAGLYLVTSTPVESQTVTVKQIGGDSSSFHVRCESVQSLWSER